MNNQNLNDGTSTLCSDTGSHISDSSTSSSGIRAIEADPTVKRALGSLAVPLDKLMALGRAPPPKAIVSDSLRRQTVADALARRNAVTLARKIEEAIEEDEEEKKESRKKRTRQTSSSEGKLTICQIRTSY